MYKQFKMYLRCYENCKLQLKQSLLLELFKYKGWVLHYFTLFCFVTVGIWNLQLCLLSVESSHGHLPTADLCRR